FRLVSSRRAGGRAHPVKLARRRARKNPANREDPAGIIFLQLRGRPYSFRSAGASRAPENRPQRDPGHDRDAELHQLLAGRGDRAVRSGSTAFYIGRITEEAIGKAAPWFILRV